MPLTPTEETRVRELQREERSRHEQPDTEVRWSKRGLWIPGGTLAALASLFGYGWWNGDMVLPTKADVRRAAGVSIAQADMAPLMERIRQAERRSEQAEERSMKNQRELDRREPIMQRAVDDLEDATEERQEIRDKLSGIEAEQKVHRTLLDQNQAILERIDEKLPAR